MALLAAATTMPTFTAVTVNADVRCHQSGFTLVELMVALALMALAATAVILTIRPGSGDAQAQAARFAARAAAIRDRAVIEQRSYGLWVSHRSIARRAEIIESFP